MSNQSNRVGAEGYASTPLSYNITSAKLYSNVINPKKNYNIDIKALIAGFEGTESINSPTVEYTIKLGDSFNLLERMKITGGEKIEIKIERRLKSGPKRYTIVCYLGEIIDYKKSGTATATYVLKCYSKHVMNEAVSILTKPFRGTAGKVIKGILENDLEVTPHYIEQSGSSVIEGIFPRIKPLHAIIWLMRNAFDDGTPYYFYETLKDGLYYRSYKSMLEEDVAEEYKFKSFMVNTKESEEGYEEERTMVTKLSSPSIGYSKFIDASSGAFASTLHAVDISTKEYKKFKFNSENNRLNRLNKNKPYALNDRTKVLNRGYNEHSDAKNYFVSTNRKAFSGRNYYSTADINFNKAMAHIENLNFQTHEITIPGNFDLCVGKKIKLIVYRNKEDTEGAGIDKAQSGTYLVSQITHRFEDGYSQELVIQKDSGDLNYETA